jgi:DNA-binding NarL/FixJ family response regulator
MPEGGLSLMKACIVDDHEIVRAGLRTLVSSPAGPQIQVVSEASSGDEALCAQRTLRPDLFLVDYRLPDMTGDKLCRSLVEARPGTSVIMLSSSSADDVIQECLRAGAAAYVTKGAGTHSLCQAVSAVAAGESGIVFRDDAASGARHPGPCSGFGKGITRQQLRVLELVAEGLTYRQIGRRLHVSESTVRFHINGVKEKLGVQTRSELLVIALRDGLIAPGVVSGPDALCPR